MPIPAEDVPTAATTDRTTDPGIASADITREVRLAVVMYGGVSLAIYINGVAQELLRLVRATAPSAPSRDDLRLADADLRGTERVYRTIARMLGGDDGPVTATPQVNAPVRVRFIVDTISGTSAGGINGIFLAKALANDQPLDMLQTLWVEEGDIGALLNDKQSRVPNTWVREGNPPTSLLNSARMYQRLVGAFDGMGAQSGTALVSEVDLFVTTTDIRGLPITLRLADGLVAERRHKHAFHFKFRDAAAGQAPVSDFTRANNRLLAFAARCTSSFPVAFEPMTVAAAAAPTVGASDRLPYADDAARTAVANFFPQYRDAATAAGVADVRGYLEHRPFGDGGYLDNKPFGYAIDALIDRRGGAPADRKLIYVEPSPDRIAMDGELGPDAVPNAFENASIAMSLARQETIRDDLLRVLDRNRLIERVERVVTHVEEDVAELQRCNPNVRSRHPDFPTLGLEELMCEGGGIAYGGYHHLKVGAVTDKLARFVANTFTLPDGSDEYLAVRLIVRVWRDARYAVYRRTLEARGPNGSPGGFVGTQNRFLAGFDLSYRVRRLSFVLNKVDHLLCLDRRASGILMVRADCAPPATAADKAVFRGALSALRDQLMPELRRLRVLHDALFEPRGTWRHDRGVAELSADEDLAPAHAALGETVAALAGGLGAGGVSILRTLLNDPAEHVRERQTAQLLAANDGAFRARVDATADALARVLQPAMERARANCERVLGIPPLHATAGVTPSPEPLDCTDYAAVARRVVADYYTGFDPFDLVLFPALYETGLGDEIAQVDVLRISPDDAPSLIDLRNGGGARRKLAGTMLGHFGAFLDTSFRTNDILWGRLDGAERLISMLLPGPELAGMRGQLVAEAHQAILDETFVEPHRAAVASKMATTLLRDGAPQHGAPRDGAPRDGAPRGSGDGRDAAGSALIRHREASRTLAALLTPAALRNYFKQAYSVDTTLDGRATMSVAARAATVVGRMLDGLDRRPPAVAATATWLTRGGRGLWTLVELSVPGSPAGYLARHWIGLLVVFALVLIVGGSLLAAQTVIQFGFTLLGVTLGVRVLMLAFADVIRGRPTWQRITAYALVVVAFLVVAFVGGHWLAGWIYSRTSSAVGARP